MEYYLYSLLTTSTPWLVDGGLPLLLGCYLYDFAQVLLQDCQMLC